MEVTLSASFPTRVAWDSSGKSRRWSRHSLVHGKESNLAASHVADISVIGFGVKIPVRWCHASSCCGALNEGCSGSPALPACVRSSDPTSHRAASCACAALKVIWKPSPSTQRCRRPSEPTTSSPTGHAPLKRSARPVGVSSMVSGWHHTERLPAASAEGSVRNSAGSSRTYTSFTWRSYLLARVLLRRLPAPAFSRSCCRAWWRPTTCVQYEHMHHG